jgi:hypothetical protein
MELDELRRILTRRDFLGSCAAGIETIALAQLLASEGRAEGNEPPIDNPLAPRPPHFEPTAKNLIVLFMAGAPSQIDLFDPKPELQKWHGQSLPPSMTKDMKLAFIQPTAKVFASPRTFKPYGESGTEFSDYLPHLATCADDICLIRSMYTEAFNHHPGQLLLMTGSMQFGRPTLGSWVSYGLGSESQDLPGFVVLSSGKGTSGGSTNWSSGFMPSVYQGVPFRDQGDPILYLSNPGGMSQEMQRERLDALRDLNQQHYLRTRDREIASRIASYELAFRMQAAAPRLIDFSDEPKHVLDSYGVNDETTRPFAVNCLLARRMVEQGVRCIMLAHSSWDDHEQIDKRLKENCAITDQPAAALLKDLKERGLLDSTLVVWGGEFGRTPLAQIIREDEGAGRDHHPDCFSMWMAGGGVRGGQVIGKTDEFGLNIVEDKVHVHDLQATLLHLLGLDHTRLTYRHMGRDFRLTDVGGELVKKALA